MTPAGRGGPVGAAWPFRPPPPGAMAACPPEEEQEQPRLCPQRGPGSALRRPAKPYARPCAPPGWVEESAGGSGAGAAGLAASRVPERLVTRFAAPFAAHVPL